MPSVAVIDSKGKPGPLHRLVKANYLEHPSHTYMMADSFRKYDDDIFAQCHYAAASQLDLRMRPAHSGRINQGFIDGHVASFTPGEALGVLRKSDNTKIASGIIYYTNKGEQFTAN